MRRLLILMLVAACALALSACGSKKSVATTTSGGSGQPQRDAAGCVRVAKPAPKGEQHLQKPTAKLDPAKRYELLVQTNCGAFTIRLDPRHYPLTAASMYSLAKQGFFDGLPFHRVAAGFVIQGGDPLGTGQGGPGYTVVERPPASATYPRGTIAMAKTEADPPGASGSQFFVVTGEDATPSLQGQYAIAGRVVAGQGVVDKIGSLDTQPPQDGAPVDPVVMSRVTVKVS